MMNEKTIKNLESKGFNRWTKGKFDRMYVNPKTLGLTVNYYNTGNVSSASWCGEIISNCEAKRILGGKYYINVADEMIHVVSNAHNSDEIFLVIKDMLDEAKV